MSNPSKPHHDPTADEWTNDEGGLRAPPGLTGWRKAWWWFDFIILVKLARLRFIAVLAIIGVIITQWDTLTAYYEKWTRPATGNSASSDSEWFCPMHPSVIRDNSRDKCPICFMPLSKRKKGSGTAEALPAGIVNRVQLSPYRVTLAGIQTMPVDYIPLHKRISTVGYVEFNERSLRTISARVKGRIDTLYVNETGQMVDANEVLASLYSPELNVTMQNLLEAQRLGNKDMLASSRNRLALLGISDDQVDEVLKARKTNTHLKIRTPIQGHVIKKYVREGQYIDEGTPLYDIADLSTVWIQAQVYEDDIAFLPTEQAHKSNLSVGSYPVSVTTRAFPGEVFTGQLAFIYPHVDQETRTVAIRVELSNPGHKLRPGTTANVVLEVSPNRIPVLNATFKKESIAERELASGKILAVPEASIIDTGSQSIVYRQESPGVYEGVLVKLGPRMSTAENVPYFPVLSGLSFGDQIVTSGSFLVDAETRLNPAAGSIYFGGSSGSKTGPLKESTVRPSTPEDTDSKIQEVLLKLPPADRALVLAQQTCPILADSKLGSMGVPIKVLIDGQPVFLCCSGCKAQALAKPQETLQRTNELKKRKVSSDPKPATSPQSTSKDPDAKIRAALAKLPAADLKLAELQQYCPVNPDGKLGSMGVPVKVMVDGKPVLLCCEGCREEALADPAKTLKTVETLRKNSALKEKSSP